MHAFKDYIYDWMGSINSCNILHSRTLKKAFQSFQTVTPLEALQDSDKEPQPTLQNISEGHTVLLKQRCSRRRVSTSSGENEESE